MHTKTRSFILILAIAIFIVAVCSCLEKTESKAAEQIDSQTIANANNDFAIRLYSKLQAAGKKNENLFFSPYSISTALAMTATGAENQTEVQMLKTLGLPTKTEKQKLHSAIGKVIKELNDRGQENDYQLSIANALWGQIGYEFLPEFIELAGNNYDGGLNEVDFAGATETTRQTINSWVEKKTNDKIQNLISKGVLDSMTRLVLTNAIYFKADWANGFKADRTQNADFTLAGGEKISVPMMNQTAEFNYVEIDNFQLLELPYINNELSMLAFLPKEIDGLGEFEKTLTIKNINQWLGKSNKCKVIVSIPKFKMTSKFNLNNVLKSLGMADAFSADADFSAMTGQKDLYISDVIHKAYVDVNEEGTEAAAATAVVMRLTSISPQELPIFRVDRPFLFLIRDNLSGTILFIGRLVNPK